MFRQQLPITVAALTLLSSLHANAIPVIPQDSGWSGHINIAVGVGVSESNMLAEILGQDLGDDTVSSLNSSPDDEDVVLPAAQFEIAYTFASMRMQAYLGNQRADHLSFDLNTTLQTHLGVRQEFGEVGNIDFSLGTTTIATDVWEDPYVVNEPRGNTERTSSGIRLIWDRILTTPLELTYSSKEVDIDDDRSGQDGGLGLTRAQQRDLRREGQVNRVDISYDWVLSEHHRLVPGIGYIDKDLDGDAMAEDGWAVNLQYLYQRQRWRLVGKLFYEELESSDTNPIYGEEREVDTTGGSVTLFYTRPFGLENWTANASASYYEADANIDFYDSSFGMFSLGMLYRFD